jgi:flagellar motor switch protein FliN/FliY
MADEGPLSQADIDALTAGLLGGGGAGFDPDALRPEADLILEQASSVIGALLGRSAAFSLHDLRAADAGTLSAAFGDDGLLVLATLEGLSGDLAFALHKRTAALLAGLMMGGDGSAEFKDDDLDAVNELGNQVLGAVCTALGARHGASVSASQARTAPLDAGSLPFPAEGAALVEADLAVDGAEPAPVWLLLSRPLAEALAGGQAPEAGSSGGLLASQGGFDGSLALSGGHGAPNIQMLLDINLNVTIELGRTRLSIRKILELGPGSIIELDRLAGEPVDLLVNDKVVAKGEVVVVDEYFGIRVISLVSPEERIKQLR